MRSSIILEGPQGIGKSTACKILAGGDQLFSDGLPLDLSNKDAMDHPPGKWLIEIAELSAFNKSDLSAPKAFMTKCDDKFRPAYGRKQIIRQRQCVFVGTTNAKVYLKDETGNRRFWPIACGKIDLDGLARDRDQLAEAVIAYKRGERWWPDRDFEQKNITPEQEARFSLDVWADKIGPYLETADRVTVSQVMQSALFLTIDRMTPVDQKRVISILQSLGWKPGRSHGVRWWVRG
jgi:predicted P-loop ATPase